MEFNCSSTICWKDYLFVSLYYLCAFVPDQFMGLFGAFCYISVIYFFVYLTSLSYFGQEIMEDSCQLSLEYMHYSIYDNRINFRNEFQSQVLRNPQMGLLGLYWRCLIPGHSKELQWMVPMQAIYTALHYLAFAWARWEAVYGP